MVLGLCSTLSMLIYYSLLINTNTIGWNTDLSPTSFEMGNIKNDYPVTIRINFYFVFYFVSFANHLSYANSKVLMEF